MKFFTALTAALVLTCGAAFADASSGGLSVHVVDPGGHPLKGVRVFAVDRGSPVEERDTDRAGNAVFMALTPGTHTIVVQNRRYNGCSHFVRISAGEQRDVTVTALPHHAACGVATYLNSSLVQPGVGADVYDIY